MAVQLSPARVRIHVKPPLLSPLYAIIIRVHVGWPGGSPIDRQTRRCVLENISQDFFFVFRSFLFRKASANRELMVLEQNAVFSTPKQNQEVYGLMAPGRGGGHPAEGGHTGRARHTRDDNRRGGGVEGGKQKRELITAADECKGEMADRIARDAPDSIILYEFPQTLLRHPWA